jgi:hypothetical protein
MTLASNIAGYFDYLAAKQLDSRMINYPSIGGMSTDAL